MALAVSLKRDVAKWAFRYSHRAACLSTLVAPPRPNLVTGSRPNLVNQTRPVGAAALDVNYEEYPILPQHTNGYHSTNGHQLVNGTLKAHESKSYDSDMIVVLDMDECLIHSKFMSQNNVAAQWAYQVARRNASDESSLFGGNHHPLGRVDSFKISLPDGDLVQVNKRPFLEEFLERVCERYETHIFTAAMKVYASPVLDTLDPYGTRFAQRWYRESCTFCESSGAYIKDLSKLPLESPHRTVLVDNNPLSFLANPSNGILVSNFYDDPTDDSLKAVMDLLRDLEDMQDVRPELEKRFGLKEALQDIQKDQEQELKI